MKNNLLSKISKLALIPALALALNTGKTNAQKLEFNPEISMGWAAGTYSDLKIYDNWQDHFKNLYGDEKLEHIKTKGNNVFDIGVDLGLSIKKFSLGLSSRYSLDEISNEKSLSAIELHDWKFDYARIHEMVLKQKAPSLGAYFKIPIGENGRLVLRDSFRKVGIDEIKREDTELSSRLKCPTPTDDTKTLTRVFERTKSKVLLNKAGLEYQFYSSGAIVGFELFYETDWNKVHGAGGKINIYWDNLY